MIPDKEFIDAAYRELWVETGIDRDAITPMFHLIDFTYYDTDSIWELYVCSLLQDVKLIQEVGGKKQEIYGDTCPHIGRLGGGAPHFAGIYSEADRVPDKI